MVMEVDKYGTNDGGVCCGTTGGSTQHMTNVMCIYITHKQQVFQRLLLHELLS